MHKAYVYIYMHIQLKPDVRLIEHVDREIRS